MRVLLALAMLLGELACAAAQSFEIPWDKILEERQRPGTGSRAPGYRLEPVNRDVLAVYDGDQEPAADRTRIHRYLELPLNHLGYRVTYWDLRDGLPEDPKRYRAIITWFGERFPEWRAWYEWAARTLQQGTRFIVLEYTGAPSGPDAIGVVNSLMRQLGVELTTRAVGASGAGKVVQQDDRMIGFEHRLDADLAGYAVMQLRPGSFKAHLTVEAAPQHQSVRVPLVVTGTGGGFAPVGYVRHYDPGTERLRWIINPFTFLASALGGERAPIPDTTTVAGRRLYFSHIDGEAWSLPSEVEAYRGLPSSEVVRRELIEPYPDLPATVGLIAADTIPALGGTASAAEVARRMFALEHVEVASHTHSYPISWAFFEDYQREKELAKVYAWRATALPQVERRLVGAAKLGRTQYQIIAGRAFGAGTPGLPRARVHTAFSVEQEVTGAISITEALAPEGKKAAAYLWSGDARPFEAAVRAARNAGVRNLNGGDARLDSDFPSLSYVPPIARPVGRERQIYAVNSSEAVYTNGWTGPHDGQLKLRETWANTDAPRRIKGMNLHYHMYTGERTASLGAVRQLLDDVRRQPVAPVSASHYAAIADSFFDVDIAKVGWLKWRIAKRGKLQTVRFDEASNLWVDLRESVGVLGFNRHGDAIYVALDAAVGEAIVQIREGRAGQRHDRPYLIDSRWQVSRMKPGACGLEAEAQGFGSGQMTWGGLKPGTYTVSVLPPGSDVEIMREMEADPNGELKIDIEASAVAGLKLKVACAKPPLRTGARSTP